MIAPLPTPIAGEKLRIAGQQVDRDGRIEVRNPYTGELVGTVPKATLEDVRRAFEDRRANTRAR
jgi:phosphonoacetaldehyde dehydrogenase